MPKFRTIKLAPNPIAEHPPGNAVEDVAGYAAGQVTPAISRYRAAAENRQEELRFKHLRPRVIRQLHQEDDRVDSRQGFTLVRLDAYITGRAFAVSI